MIVSARATHATVCGALLLLAAGIATLRLWSADPSEQHRNLTLLYVGADDCAPCRNWQRDAGVRFRADPAFAAVSYREVKSPTLHAVLDDAHWPIDLRGYRDGLERSAGVPLWLVIADGTVVARGFGARQWQDQVLPTLRSLRH